MEVNAGVPECRSKRAENGDGRELEIFTLLASGHSNQQIGDELSLSTNTVAKHLTSILAKLHLENRIQAAVHAVRAGIN